MSDYYAMTWKVRAGTEEEVAKLFEGYGRPDHTIRDDDGNEVGRLLSTQVFMRENTIVRVLEVEGANIIDVAKHMRAQPAIRDLESRLDGYLEEPRDMSTPEGARAFFMKTLMRCLVARRHDE
jgi:hypothetical protein